MSRGKDSVQDRWIKNRAKRRERLAYLGISGNMAVIVSTSSSVIFFGLNPNARAATLSGSLDGVEAIKGVG